MDFQFDCKVLIMTWQNNRSKGKTTKNKQTEPEKKQNGPQEKKFLGGKNKSRKIMFR